MTVKDNKTILLETRRGVGILLKIRNTKDLVEDFILTGFMEETPELSIVRGWIMNELQRRNPKAFIAWLDSEDCTDASLRKYFKIRGGLSNDTQGQAGDNLRGGAPQ